MAVTCGFGIKHVVEGVLLGRSDRRLALDHDYLVGIDGIADNVEVGGADAG